MIICLFRESRLRLAYYRVTNTQCSFNNILHTFFYTKNLFRVKNSFHACGSRTLCGCYRASRDFLTHARIRQQHWLFFLRTADSSSPPLLGALRLVSFSHSRASRRILSLSLSSPSSTSREFGHM